MLDHAAYVVNWLQVLRNDTRAIYTAAAKAQRSIDYAYSLQPEPAQDLEILQPSQKGQLSFNL